MDGRVALRCCKTISPLLFIVILFAVGDIDAAFAQSFNSENYYPRAIVSPQDRAWLRSIPIEQRPNRPLHFYGNAVRGRSAPRPSYNVRVIPQRVGPERGGLRSTTEPRLFRTNTRRTNTLNSTLRRR